MAEPLERAWTLDEFFSWQERQQDRYELVNGRPLKIMAGARNVHDDIVVNILFALVPQLRVCGCRPFTGDGAAETYPSQIRRPDVGVDCGRRDPYGYKAVEPRLLLEVFSPSTRDSDAFGKLADYKSIATLSYVVFVEPDAPMVSLWSRNAVGDWVQTKVTDMGGRLELLAIGAHLEMSAIYDGVAFPAASNPPT